MAGAVIYTVNVPVRLNSIDAFRAVATEMMTTVGHHSGHLAHEVMEPVDGTRPVFTIMIEFDGESALRDWLGTELHSAFVDRIVPLMSGDYAAELRSGMGIWVPPAAGRAPPKYKAAIATFIGLFPLLLLLRIGLGKLGIGRLDPTLGLAISLALSCIMMTWLVMPFVTRLLAPWLYAPSRR
jgi:uncharacterized protein